MTDVAGVIGSSFALDSEFLSVVTLPVAMQPTDDIMLLSGWNSMQATGFTIDKQTIGLLW